MKIKQIKASNYIGIKEINWNPGNINIIEGPKGSGKSSLLELIEKAFSNNDRRTEVIRHGENESTMFIRTDNMLEVDRRIRNNKSNYLKLKGNMVQSSTETELRKFLAGDIFRPLDFIDLSVDEQTEIILSMIKMNYSAEDINNWFGEDVLSNINTSKHILQILKDIERKYYNERQEVNRDIKTLEAQVKGIEAELPPNYDGEKWKDKRVQEYYEKVSKARDLKEQLENAENLRENFANIINRINAEAERERVEIGEKYRDKADESRGKMANYKSAIADVEDDIEAAEIDAKNDMNKVDDWLQKEIEKLKEEAKEKKEDIKSRLDFNIKAKEKTIQNFKERISAQKEFLNGLDDKERIEIESVNKETKQKIKNEKDKLGQASKLLEEKESIEDVQEKINKLQEEADKVANMREYLNEWNRMVDIRDGKLAKKRDYSDHLTNLIEIAREKPSELLQQHELPLEGISIDEESRIRINGTLLDGLSDGEKLEVSLDLAKQRIGQLRVMCVDGIEKLNESEQEKVIRKCEEHDIQAYITRTVEKPDNKFEIIDESKQKEICETCKHKKTEGDSHCYMFEKMLVGCMKHKPKPEDDNNE